jgi:pyruvate kinase
LALVNDVKLARRLALQWGMLARVVPLPASQEALIAIAEANAVALLGAQPGDDIAILSPCLPQQSGQTLTLWKVSHGL